MHSEKNSNVLNDYQIWPINEMLIEELITGNHVALKKKKKNLPGLEEKK